MREVVLFAKNKRFGLRTHAVQVIHERRFKSRPVFKIHFRSCLHKPSVPPAVFLQWFLPISLQAVYEQIVVIRRNIQWKRQPCKHVNWVVWIVGLRGAELSKAL